MWSWLTNIWGHGNRGMCSFRCEEALEVNKMLITEEQADLQKELVKSFKDFRDKLEPMVSTKKKHKRSRYVAN